MFAESFSMVVGVAVGGGDEVVGMGVILGDVGVELADRGINEPKGLLGIVGWAGPITCRKCNNLG